MSIQHSKKRRLKYVFVAFACAASFSLTGLAAACKTDEKETDEGKTTSVEDSQLLKNGNFEFFDVPEQKDGEKAPEYLINTPKSWSKQGTTSYTMSGIIGTSDKAWERLTAENLADRLDANNALDSSSSTYKAEHIDFNGMKSSDILYKDSYGALKYGTISSSKDGDTTKYYIDESDKKVEIFFKEADNTYYYDAELTRPVNKELIENPLAHNIFKDENGVPKYYDAEGKAQDIEIDENGNYFLKYDKAKEEYSESVGNVLMLHNYSNSGHNGIAQNYASVEVSLPANTSAEVSVWVKTSNLLFSQGKPVNEDQDHGANITVTHTAGSSTLDDFKITSINTEKLLGAANDEYDGKYNDKNNGWVEYTVYINACDFASSTITLKLGLGETDSPVEGYAFFDDVTVTKYVDLSKCPSYTDEVANKIVSDKAVCSLTSDASEKVFVADTFERNGGAIKEDRYSKCFNYLLDLASESKYSPVDFSKANASAGLTVDSDNYVSSKTDDFNNAFANKDMTGTAKLPDDLKNLKIDGKGENPGIDTSGDLLTLVKAGHKFTEIKNTKYNEQLTEALEYAPQLPNADENSDMLVLFSAKGAAYTASFDLTIAPEGYQIISFWVKTSDMDGNTAATVKITEKGNDDNSANVTLDTTNIATDIDDDNKDIYKGWAQCFFFVHNDTPDKEGAKDAELHIEFSFGNTTIKGTTVTSYKPGWAALANVQTLTVDEDVFAYTGSGNYTASLTVKEDEKKTANVFDDYMEGQKTQIETGFADPSSYTGANGGSSKVVNTGVISPFDGKNPSGTAGLLNRDYVEEYAKQQWYKDILSSFNVSATDAVSNWNQVFGAKSVQPLVISNTTREGYILKKNADKDTYKNYYYYDEDKQDYVKVTDEEFDDSKKYYSLQEVLNYGFIGGNQTVSSNGFTTVSVRVKVSEGAIAYIYLVDTSDTTKVLGFNAPSYTFWYDEDGNVLKSELDEKASLAEQRANVLYTLRDDGLYEDGEGNLRANIWNYTKLYNANITYYTKDGGKYSLDELVEGEIYYSDEACEKLADCFLVTSDGTKIYERKDGKYYYIVKGETQKNEVLPFEIDKGYERYSYEGVSEEYTAKVECTDGKWVTVNFVIHAGSESKQYRLELWSGKRGEYKTEGNNEGGSVIFDYSYTSISSDDLLSQYENDIIKAYQSILAKNGLLDKDSLKEIALTDKSINDYNLKDYKELVDKAVADGKIPQSDVDGSEILNSYKFHYYTYSLYDSADFVPFNKDIADENSTGYNYSVNDYEETLAYLAVTDKPAENSEDGYTYTVFTDYSTINQSIELDTGNTDEDEGEDEDEDKDKDTANVWLLASSIILVAALIFAMIAILIKDTLKKNRRNRALSKNNYNSNKANHYYRRLGIKKEEIEEVDAKNEAPEQPEETEEQVEEVTEQPVEEVTETPAEEVEAPAEESAENSDNPEDGQE